MTHLIAIVMVLGLSGLPAGSLLCGLSCAPEETTVPSCHEHGGTADNAPAMYGVHLCDQDAVTVPLIASPAFSIAVADVAAPHMHSRLSLPERVAISHAWELPPGVPSGRLPASPSVLRV